jgi:hypothetical protein
MDSALHAEAAAIAADAANEGKKQTRRQRDALAAIQKKILAFNAAHPNAQVLMVVLSAYSHIHLLELAVGPMGKDPAFCKELLELNKNLLLAHALRPDRKHKVAIDAGSGRGYAGVEETVNAAVAAGDLGERQGLKLLNLSSSLHAGKWAECPLCAATLRLQRVAAESATRSMLAAAVKARKKRQAAAFGASTARGAGAGSPQPASSASRASEDESSAGVALIFCFGTCQSFDHDALLFVVDAGSEGGSSGDAGGGDAAMSPLVRHSPSPSQQQQQQHEEEQLEEEEEEEEEEEQQEEHGAEEQAVASEGATAAAIAAPEARADGAAQGAPGGR